MKRKSRLMTYDTVTGNFVDPRQSESFDGRFQTEPFIWEPYPEGGGEWIPLRDVQTYDIAHDDEPDDHRGRYGLQEGN